MTSKGGSKGGNSKGGSKSSKAPSRKASKSSSKSSKSSKSGKKDKPEYSFEVRLRYSLQTTSTIEFPSSHHERMRSDFYSQLAFWQYGYLNKTTAPEVLGGGDGNAMLVSGTRLTADVPDTPFKFAPQLGCANFVPYPSVSAESSFTCVSASSYGDLNNSPDYPLHLPAFNLEPDFEFGPAPNDLIDYENSFVVEDTDGYLQWENGAEISLQMFVPDASWNDVLVGSRALTGADFSLQGMVLATEINAITYSGILADSYSPILLPSTVQVFAGVGQRAVISSPFIRVPDIMIPELELSPVREAIAAADKTFCDLNALQTGFCTFNNEPPNIPVNDPTIRIVKGGFGGLASLEGGLVAGVFKFQEDNEPGVRVYEISPGACQGEVCSPPEVTGFFGFYPLEPGSETVQDVTGIPSSNSSFLVIESDPFSGTSTSFVYCVVDVDRKLSDGTLEKACVLDNDDIFDQFNATVFLPGNSFIRAGGVLVVDENCFFASTDSNFPSSTVTLEYGLLNYICFDDPIFNETFLEPYFA